MKRLLITIFISILSVANFGYLAFHHYELRMGMSGGQSICNVSQTFNCDTAAASSFSVAFGIPIAVWGMVSQVLLLLLLTIAFLGLNQNKERVLRYGFYLSGVFALVSLVMLSISTFQLGSFCPFCMVSYVLSFLLIYFTYTLIDKPNPAEDFKDLFQSHKWVLVMGLATLASAWLVNSILKDNFGMDKLKPYITENVGQWKVNPEIKFDESIGLSTSKEPAKFTIVEFADFKCPHCKMAAPTLHAFKDAHKDVKIIFKPFPLDAGCNAVIQRGGDELRCIFPAAVFCADQQNSNGWKLHNWIFENQEKWFAPIDKSTVIKQMAELIGADASSLEQCIQSDTTLARVKANAAEGAAAKIQGTPAVFVNGRLLERGQFLPVLEEAYLSLQTQ